MFGIDSIRLHLGHWVTPAWLNTWYGPQIQLGWLVVAVRMKKVIEFDD